MGIIFIPYEPDSRMNVAMRIGPDYCTWRERMGETDVDGIDVPARHTGASKIAIIS
jgi:hypothetical protein